MTLLAVYGNIRPSQGDNPRDANRIDGGAVDHILSKGGKNPVAKEVAQMSDYEMLMVMLTFTSIIVVLIVEYIKK